MTYPRILIYVIFYYKLVLYFEKGSICQNIFNY